MEDVIEYVIAMEDGNDFITENKDEADERFEQLKELDRLIMKMKNSTMNMLEQL